MAAELPAGHVGDVGSADAHRSGRGFQQAHDATPDRGLARTALPDQYRHLAFADAQRDAVDGLHRAEVHHQVLQLEGHILPAHARAATRCLDVVPHGCQQATR